MHAYVSFGICVDCTVLVSFCCDVYFLFVYLAVGGLVALVQDSAGHVLYTFYLKSQTPIENYAYRYSIGT